jgi:hypothetical protein
MAAIASRARGSDLLLQRGGADQGQALAEAGWTTALSIAAEDAPRRDSDP